MGAAAVPIMMGATSLGQAYFGSRRSGEEKRLLGAQTNQLNQLSGQGASLFGAGMPAMRSAISYYDTLLRGDRASQAQALAGPVAGITDLYRGTEANLQRSGVRGGVKDLATAELGRDRANQIGQLTAGVQPQAASALAAMGSSATGQAQGATGGAAAGFGGMAQGATAHRMNRADALGNATSDIGELLFHAWRSKAGGGSKPAGPNIGTRLPLPTAPGMG